MSTPKTALIIGASRGLGLGLVKQLLQDGWDVTATVRDPNKADALKAVGPVQIEKLDMALRTVSANLPSEPDHATADRLAAIQLYIKEQLL